MRPLALACILMIGTPTLALAMTPCPTSMDYAVSPYGTCVNCTVPGNPIPFTSNVVILGNGSLGCEIQVKNPAAQCGDPNLQRCGGVLPSCNPIDICIDNTATTCVVAPNTNLPTFASTCYFPPGDLWAGLVDPTKCTCYTTTMVRPLTDPEKAAQGRLVGVTGVLSSAFWLIYVAQPSIPVSLRLIWKAASAVMTGIGLKAKSIQNDPPLPDFTKITRPEGALATLTPYFVTTGDGLRPAQVTDLNNMSELVNEIWAGEQAAMKSLDRSSGALDAASPQYYEAQLDAFDYAIAYLQPRYALLASTLSNFCTSGVWASHLASPGYAATPDYRPMYQQAGVCDPASLQTLQDLSVANLMSQR